MLDILLHSFVHALMITIFVFMMMVIVEYINIVARGKLRAVARGRVLGQNLFAGALGATPGCLGAFTNVTLYEHGILSFGALVAGMMATSGDEAFVMLSMFPGRFLLLTAILLVIGIASGIFIDKVFSVRFVASDSDQCDELVVHAETDRKRFRRPLAAMVSNLSGPNLARWAILVFFLTYALLIATGLIGYEEQLWWKLMLIAAAAVCMWIAVFGSQHFIREHVWGHVIIKHVPRIFLWTFGALFLFEILSQYIDLPQVVHDNRYLMLAAACIIGIIPQSGPHLIFVTLFANGALPFSILLASCIVQDGHGMLPLLAFSRRDFIAVKAINVLIAALVGTIALTIGY